MGFVILVSAIVKFLTQLPAAFPGLLMWSSSPRITEYSLSMNRAEGGKCIA
jgi:hypothetical protein